VKCRYCGIDGAEESATIIDDESTVYIATRCKNPRCAAYDSERFGWHEDMLSGKKDVYDRRVRKMKLLPVPV